MDLLRSPQASSNDPLLSQSPDLEDWLPRVLNFVRELYQDNPLSTVQENVFCRCWLGYTYREIADELSYDRIYVRAIGAQLWQSFSKKLGQRVTKSNFQPLLQQRIADCQQEAGQNDQTLAVIPVLPRRAEAASSPAPFPDSASEAIGLRVSGLSDYIDRPPLEARCCEAILQPGALIRVKAPKQMGKTALVHRILHDASQHRLKTVCLSLKLADAEIFANLDRFLQWFCAIVEDQLELPSQLEQIWKPIFGSNYNCTNYFARHILTHFQEPLVLALDDVDIIFQYPEIAVDFLGLLRAWCEKSKHATQATDVWQQLRLVVAHSTEVYIPLQHNQSPFNIGLSVGLPEFTVEQVVQFARCYGLYWDPPQAHALMEWVGGKPELLRLTLEAIAAPDPPHPHVSPVSLESLLKQARADGGIYREHLRRQFRRLQDYPDLLPAVAQVMTTETEQEAIALDPVQGFQLESLGLVKLEGYHLKPSCRLYRHYFREILRQ